MRTLAWSMLLVCIPLYTIALVMRETVGSYEDASETAGAKHFTTLGAAFFSIFRCVVAGDCSDKDGRPIFVLIVDAYGWGFAVIYFAVLLLFNFGLYNVIVAIFVENSVAASKYNQSSKKRLRLMNNKMLAEKACEMVHLIVHIYAQNNPEDDKVVQFSRTSKRNSIASVHDGKQLDELLDIAADLEISKSFWNQLFRDLRFQELLTDLDVSSEDQLDLFDTFDVDGGGTLDLAELLLGVKKLRGDPHRSDVIGVSLMVRGIQEIVTEMQQSLQDVTKKHESALRKLHTTVRQSMVNG
eukprot:TRINITY_DN25551_c0_g1_i2.p1 TRINITY_DN25551_c0_g1~~TRINITY_DN25551_c0_g1_i2.p1  ORF type:complete len:298 (+),score=49.89 TRINITY_DN25551_c0_g1_i2:152-1045(+)